jgi:hypothetical protein
MQNGLLLSPIFFVNRVPVNQINKLSKVILEHGGRIVGNEEKATHIIDWYDEMDNNNVSLETIRAVKITTGHLSETSSPRNFVQVHWVGFPDSYDEILPGSEIDQCLPDTTVDAQTLYAQFTTRSKFFVTARFVSDCDLFNEWGNETDYETPFADDDEIDSSGKKVKSKRRNLKKEQGQGVNCGIVVGSDKLYFPELLPSSLTPLTGNAVVMDINGSTPAIQAQRSSMQPDSKTDDELPSTSILGKRLHASIDAPYWYCSNSISDIERRYLQSFLNDGESSYFAIRNAIVSFYLQNPGQYLSATECRRKIAADTSKVIRLHEFLDAFGVINYKVRCESRPTSQIALLDDMAKSLKKQELLDKLSSQPNFGLGHNVARTSTPTSDWSVEMDNALLSLISSRKKDWRSIATEMQRLYDVSLVQCMMRFLEMPMSALPFASTISNDVHSTQTVAKLAEIDPGITGLNQSSSSFEEMLPNQGMVSSKDEMVMRVKQSIHLIHALEKLIVQMKVINHLFWFECFYLHIFFSLRSNRLRLLLYHPM